MLMGGKEIPGDVIADRFRRFVDWQTKVALEAKALQDEESQKGTVTKAISELLRRVNLFPELPQYCSCISTLLNPSWASAVNGFTFHVCDSHAKQFEIPATPYEGYVLRLLLQGKDPYEGKRRRGETGYSETG